MKKFNTLQVLVKTAAVGGIAFFWVNFTVESLKLAWHKIIFSGVIFGIAYFTVDGLLKLTREKK